MKITIVCQHFSTGGMPQYTLKIALFLETKGYSVSIIEVDNYSNEYTVQRKKVSNLIQLQGDHSLLIGVLVKESPDFIYFQEIPESYLNINIVNYIYFRKDWIKWVTTHSNKSNKSSFDFIPDKIITVNTWQQDLFVEEFKAYHTIIEKWEYPIEDKKSDKLKAKTTLEMTGYNVLNIGLFTPGKNQGELFEVARQNPDKTYHFVGNQAVNFKDYWEPLMVNKPNNCIIWGEREDTDLFYQACDEFYFTSKFELCPIVIKEALSWKLPVKMYYLPSYGTVYDHNPLVTYLEDTTIQNNYTKLKNIAIQEIEVKNIYEKYFEIQEGDVVVDIGAHVGIFTKKALEKASMVYAVEPDPMFIKDLKTLKSKKLKVFEAGIADKIGHSRITSDGNPNEIGVGNVEIPIITFKHLCSYYDISKIDFLKLDCEGGEYDIFTKENMPWISENVKNIAGELHIHTEEQKAYIPYMLMLIKKAGFNIIITSVDGFIIQNVTEHLDYYKEVLFYITKQPMEQPFSINVNYVNGPFIELKGLPEDKYTIEFVNEDTGEIPYRTTIGTNSWAKCNIEYFVNWTINVYKGQELFKKIPYTIKNATVFIAFGSKSLGDTLAWFPYVEEFRKKHNCNIIVSTFLNDLFKDTYPEIKFVNPGERVDNINAQYNIGWYYNADTVNISKNPFDPKKQPLQKTATDILGLPYKELKPKLNLPEVVKKEYSVGLGIHSTTQAKYWNNPTGWQEVTDYIKSQGYVPLVISKEEDGYMGNHFPKGSIILSPRESMADLIEEMCHLNAFVGIGSGLTWLAWACNIPVILISGFSEKYTEMQDCVRVSAPDNSCKGCFNSHKLDPGDWNWCPVYKYTPKQFECSKNITAESVIKELATILA